MATLYKRHDYIEVDVQRAFHHLSTGGESDFHHLSGGKESHFPYPQTG